MYTSQLNAPHSIDQPLTPNSHVSSSNRRRHMMCEECRGQNAAAADKDAQPPRAAAVFFSGTGDSGARECRP